MGYDRRMIDCLKAKVEPRMRRFNPVRLKGYLDKPDFADKLRGTPSHKPSEVIVSNSRSKEESPDV